MLSTYSVQFYVNGYITARLEGLSPNEAYTQGVPGEALNQTQGSRWHLMLRDSALQRLNGLLAGQSLLVCWQDPADNNWSDTEHVLIIKDPVGVHMQVPVPAPAPVPPPAPAPVQPLLEISLLNDIQALINNMIVNQDNQNNLINNIRNRLFIINNTNAVQNNLNNNPNSTHYNGFQ